MLSQIAAGCDSEIGTRLLQSLKRAGVEFHLSSKVQKIDGNTVHYLDADGAAHTIVADWVLNSTGRAPAVKGLGLEEVGVDFGPRGIKTSDQGKTNIPGIWACGDVTGRRRVARTATREGIVAVNDVLKKGRSGTMRFLQ